MDKNKTKIAISKALDKKLLQKFQISSNDINIYNSASSVYANIASINAIEEGELLRRLTERRKLRILLKRLIKITRDTKIGIDHSYLKMVKCIDKYLHDFKE